MKQTLTLIGAVLFAFPALAIQPSIGDVKDNRTTGQFFAGLEVEVKLVGDELTDYKAIRASVEKAIDDTGRNILDESQNKDDFEEIGAYGMNQNSVQLKFKNPARKATTVSQIVGKLEFYNPALDPQATIKVPNILSMSGKALENPALKAAGVTFSVLSAADLKRKKDEDAKKQADEARKQGMSEEMVKSMMEMFGGFMEPGENSITAEVVDPGNKIVNFRFLKTDGEELNRQSMMTSGTTRTLDFSDPIPADVALEIQLLTPKALAMVPLNLTNVALP